MHTEIVFTFRTTRHALKAEKAFADGGLPARVMPRPSALGEGCGICLRVDESAGAEATALLAASGVEVEAAYRKTRAGGATCYASVR